ncbi:M14 family zinc carboxypeptidase [Jejudonia soesokkakensis]|uniref:M14 family zinc carboxypeptidase n=1 Tax=Jejudonia soesokkakensis TaxID=1323432 RepID=A0ABW2MU28_9FLAO
MNYIDWYKHNFEAAILGRYVTLEHIQPVLESYKNVFKTVVAGYSEKEQKIPLIKIGHGKKVVLAWSQMHGNESTTTKAIFDFFAFLSKQSSFQPQVDAFKQQYTFYVLPMLNPDGAAAYTRENANMFDLNRDALELSQRESMLLRSVFDSVKPDLCLNLHDQRTIYGLSTKKPATISFLSPAANKKRSITIARIESMQLIAKMNAMLQQHIPGQVGRYDDTFNVNCVGDTFQKKEVPTILFEAGHFPDDYQREKTREYIFYALLALFDIIPALDTQYDVSDYLKIPQNQKNFKDIILRNVNVATNIGVTDVAIQYSEQLIKGAIQFVPVIDFIGDLSDIYGHVEQDLKGKSILLNSHKNLQIGQELLKINDDTDTINDYFTIK